MQAAEEPVSKGLSIHVGLNSVDPAHYAGWSGELVACEFDANDMEALARAHGFEPRVFLTRKATADALTEAIREAADELGEGDMLFVSYSGHGGQVPDTSDDEPDRLDETWCLFDRQLVDDELYTLWSQFRAGVRILVLSDSCHSGSAARDALETIGVETLAAATATSGARGTAELRLKVLPEEYVPKVYAQHRELYDDLQAGATANDRTEIPVHVLLISGCQDNQTSADGDRNGLFTQTLRTVWGDGAFTGDYRSFWKTIVEAMPPWQSPNFFWAGEPSTAFERQRPFTI
jgi:23S rRNA U2552 (ribose-2'-O)-methylase RlmE/FtsJ